MVVMLFFYFWCSIIEIEDKGGKEYIWIIFIMVLWSEASVGVGLPLLVPKECHLSNLDKAS